MDPNYNKDYVSVYFNENTKKVVVSLSGELSPDTMRQVLMTGVDKTRRVKYRVLLNQVLKKYYGWNISVAGHSNGALNLIDLLSDGDVNQEAATFLVVNPPVVRDKQWRNKVNAYITHKPDHVRVVQSQYDFGHDDFLGSLDRPMAAGYDPNLHFQSFNTLTVAYPGSDGSLD